MSKNKKYTIWQNYNINLDDWRDYLEEEYPDVEDEDEQYKLIVELNDMYLDDERANLAFASVNNGLIAIANLGFWYGRVDGYKEVKGNQISDCLEFEESCWYAEWYVDELNDLWSRQSHHDGTHYILYRAWKDNISHEQKENFMDKIYEGKATRADITHYTRRLGDDIAKVY